MESTMQQIIVEQTGLPVRESDIDAAHSVSLVAKVLEPYPLNPFSPVPEAFLVNR